MKSTAKLSALALSALLAASPLSALASEYAVVRGGGLNLRREASLSSSVLGQYPTGTWIEILESGSDWDKVSVSGKSGYMMNKYLSDGSSLGTLYVATTTGRGLNLRSAPSYSGKILTSFPAGTAVKLLLRGNGWYKVQIGDQTGYMASRYLTGSKAPSYTTPVTSPYTATLININGGSVVNFRKAPGMKTVVLSQLPVGTQVKVLETGINWSLVEVNGAQGYVSSYFLKK